jgi:hypothetical protein
MVTIQIISTPSLLTDQTMDHSEEANNSQSGAPKHLLDGPDAIADQA